MRIIEKKEDNKSRGSSLFFAVLIMSILLAVGLGMSTLLLTQMRMIRGMGDSVVAFYAADTGIEKALFELYKTGILPPCSGLCSNPPTSPCVGNVGEASYCVEGYSAGEPKCLKPPNQYFCIKSIGTYKGTRRAIEVSY